VLVVLLLVCWMPAASRAQSPQPLAEKSLEELMTIEVATVYGASRHEQKVSDAPSSVTIISRDDIRMFGYRTLAEALSGVRGFYVTYDRQYASQGIRGFSRPADYNSRVLLLIDGHRLNDNLFDQASIGTDFPLDIDLVDRIEVIRGPGSALYGTSAFFAVVNVITRQGRSVDGAEVSSEGASFGTWRARATAGRRFGANGSWIASATSMRSDGPSLYFAELDSPQTNFGRTSGTDGDRLDSAFASVTQGPFTATALYGSREKRVPTAPYGTVFDDPRTRSIDRHGYADLQYRVPAWGDGEFLVRGFFDDYRYRGRWVYDEGAVVNRDEAVGQWLGAEALVSRRLHRRHQVTGGLEFRANVNQNQRNFDETPALVYLDDQRDSVQWAAFAQDEVELTASLRAVLGARFDHTSLSGSTVEPRAGIVFSPSERTSVKALFGTAFRAPNVFEMFYTDASSKPNPDLAPESLFTSEVVFEHYVRGFRFTAAAYRSTIDDLVNQTLDQTDGLLQYRNLDSAEAWGTEAEVEYRWRSGRLARASYSYQRATDDRTNRDLTNAPRHLAVVSAGSPVWSHRIVLGAEAHYVGSRLSREHQPVDGYWLTRANVIARVIPDRVELSIGVGNLFDTRYADPAGSEQVMDVIEQDGRTARVGLLLRF
jgi:iron complex outermembrane receptor protein